MRHKLERKGGDPACALWEYSRLSSHQANTAAALSPNTKHLEPTFRGSIAIFKNQKSQICIFLLKSRKLKNIFKIEISVHLYFFKSSS